jgi:hypothetical protein
MGPVSANLKPERYRTLSLTCSLKTLVTLIKRFTEIWATRWPLERGAIHVQRFLISCESRAYTASKRDSVGCKSGRCLALRMAFIVQLGDLPRERLELYYRRAFYMGACRSACPGCRTSCEHVLGSDDTQAKTMEQRTSLVIGRAYLARRYRDRFCSPLSVLPAHVKQAVSSGAALLCIGLHRRAMPSGRKDDASQRSKVGSTTLFCRGTRPVTNIAVGAYLQGTGAPRGWPARFRTPMHSSIPKTGPLPNRRSSKNWASLWLLERRHIHVINASNSPVAAEFDAQFLGHVHPEIDL